MSRPEKDSPEWRLWVAAIEVVIDAPLASSNSVAAKIPWVKINELRAALDAVGIDWRTVKAESPGWSSGRVGEP